MGYGLTRSRIFPPENMGYPTHKKRIFSDKLEDKSNRCLFVRYLKEILDISSTTRWNKSYLFQSI